ncbi:Uncharacterized protein APZ42_019210 [Daphnia magna]|uniref:Uncharacterized protein n=1 Tax=Daphnia magna TaxID=35525 RepID=A0A164YDS5_9CRUS|nr:Uncharacterized protein APZ42_019210 [Daphnia magna]
MLFSQSQIPTDKIPTAISASLCHTTQAIVSI